MVTSEGYLITAYHVVRLDPNADKVLIKGVIGSLSGQPEDLEIVTPLIERDIALLRFKNTSQPYDPIPMGDPFRVTIGHSLCSLSFSAPLALDFHASPGTLSAKNVTDTQAGITNLWATTVPSNYGESGAPVVDLIGGGVVAIKHGGRDPATTQSVNYLIPINLAKSMLQDYCDVKIPPVAAPQVAEAGLESLKVRFQVLGSDTDFTTTVGVLVARGGTRLASNIFDGLKFDRRDVYGPYNMRLGPMSVTKSMYQNSDVTLSLRPNGHDTWITAMTLEAKFHDGEVIRSESGELLVNQDANTIKFQPQHLASVGPAGVRSILAESRLLSRMNHKHFKARSLSYSHP